jgi:hypothetical protein
MKEEKVATLDLDRDAVSLNPERLNFLNQNFTEDENILLDDNSAYLKNRRIQTREYSNSPLLHLNRLELSVRVMKKYHLYPNEEPSEVEESSTVSICFKN